MDTLGPREYTAIVAAITAMFVGLTKLIKALRREPGENGNGNLSKRVDDAYQRLGQSYDTLRKDLIAEQERRQRAERDLDDAQAKLTKCRGDLRIARADNKRLRGEDND